VKRPERRTILGVGIDVTSYADATRRVMDWAKQGESRYVCLGVVASVMEAIDSSRYREALAAADLVAPDGMPLVWMLRRLGAGLATRVYGPDLTLEILRAAEGAAIPVGFYGSAPEVLQCLLVRLGRQFPALSIAFAEAPPFRPPTPQEDEETLWAIRASGAKILFIGLGGTKQDLWMADHRGRVPSVMLGVGAAFDFLGGTKPQAPGWMQRNGLEWLFRLATEPRRLGRRYLRHNPRFAVRVVAQILRARFT
jgi:N-acetylglucosaminyldiphosphoundecaprenol N-acetyl-beta-D-mannosaminyltransferase